MSCYIQNWYAQYSPDLAPMDFKVFSFSVKAELCGREFETTAEMTYELVASETDWTVWHGTEMF